YMEGLPEGSVVLLSFDFDPSSKPELYPMAIALLRHAFRRNLKVLGMTLWITGTSMAESLFAPVAQESGKAKGRDYAFLGYGSGRANVSISLGQDLFDTLGSGYSAAAAAQFAMLKQVRSLREVPYEVSLSAGAPGVEHRSLCRKETCGFELGGQCR